MSNPRARKYTSQALQVRVQAQNSIVGRARFALRNLPRGGDVQIHRLVLKRIDGSETRRNFVAVSADAPRIGAMIQLAIDRHIRVQARVTALQTITFGSRDGRQGTIELTVRAQEVMFVPVADNDP